MPLNVDKTVLDWSESVRVEGSAERDRFVESHVDLVRYVALRIAPRLPASADVDDMIHDGIVGLLDAVNKFSPEHGVKFRTYAERRVRGAIVDGLRKKDWQPRALRRKQRELDAARTQLSSLLGREPDDEELSKAMNMPLDEFQRLQGDIAAGSILPLEDTYERSSAVIGFDDRAPHSALERKQMAQALADAIANLPRRELRVLELYYHEGLNMKEVGVLLGITESRVCQLHSQAATRLRTMLRERTAPARPSAALRGKR